MGTHKCFSRLVSGAIFLSAVLFCSTDLQAQSQPQTQSQTRVRLKGQIVDASSGEGVPYATVSILDSLSAPIAAWATDGKGMFDSEVRVTGRHTVSASAIGFDRSSKEYDIAAPATDIGQLQLSSGGIQIEGVVVTAAVPLVRADVDKISYNVTADPEAPVNTLLDMLRKVPLLSVDAEDNVLVQGQSNYKVLVNGKSSPMMDRSFKEVVRSMPANSIKNIEVITNPSSRYEAEGIGGIINIVTNRGALGGFNGSLSLGADSFGSFQANTFLSATTGKFSVSGYVAGIMQRRPTGRSHSWQENLLSDEFRFRNSESSSRQNIDAVIYQLQASYEIDSLNLLTMSLMGQHLGAGMPNDSRTTFTDPSGVVMRDFTSIITSDIKPGYLSGNFDYQRLFRKPDRVLTASYMISTDRQDQHSLTRIDGLVNYPSYLQRTRDNVKDMGHTFQLDYVDPLSDKHSIETGVKFILRQSDSDPETSERPTDADPWTVDPARRNGLDYDRYIMGLYGAYTFKLSKFSIKAGARLENSWNHGVFLNSDADTPFDNRQFNVIPYATLSFTPKPGGSRYSLSYTQRLSRPGIWYLNPYVNDLDPMNISFGNPDLDAEVAHTFNATYGIFGPKTSLNLTAIAMFVNNGIELLATADENGVTTSTYHNIGREAHYSLNGYFSWRPSGKFTFSANVNSSWVELEGTGGRKNNGLWYNANAQTRVALWKGGAVTANAYYSAPQIQLQGEGMKYYYYGMGLSQQAFKQKVTFTLSTNMPFQKELHYTSSSEDPTFRRRNESWSPARTVRFNASWNFGKSQVQVKRARRSISNDDQKGNDNAISAGQ